MAEIYLYIMLVDANLCTLFDIINQVPFISNLSAPTFRSTCLRLFIILLIISLG